MNLPKKIRIRNRAIILILLPATIFLWLIGWTLYWADSKTKPQKPQPTAETITPTTTTILLEDYEEIKT